MFLPNQLELQTLFSGFLFGAGLSAVSVKNYLSDMRHFLSYCASISSQDNPPTVQEIFQNVSKYLDSYLLEQKKSYTPQNTINRRSASIRRFSTFLASKYGLVSGLQNSKLPSLPATNTQNINQDTDDDSLPTIKKILDHFKVFLVKEKKTHSTVKNYVSDLNHFFAWSASETPFLDQNLENILSESHLNTYVTYLKLSHTGTSVINRRQSSIKQFARYCFLQKFIPTNPFEYKRETPRLLPLSWLDRLTSSKNRSLKKDSKSRLGIWYQKYNSLPFTPYLHLAILVLATSAMVIFGYNQIIKQAVPSSAALPTVPRRQLSFQGRLTDSSATPITTSVNVVFKLWNALPLGTGTQLYTSGTCAIIPDQNGIFNTLIGDGTCGAEIANTVFTENRDVYLEVTVGSEILSPRQQIATVGYALNSETLQGYPASATATINTVPIVDNNGDINIAATSPNINSNSGTFTLSGQALTLTTITNSGGDIVLQPDAIGGGQVQMLGGTTNTDFLRIENANLTSGALISGYVGNNTATGQLIRLTSGSTETNRFYVNANGQTVINTAATLANAGLIVNQTGTGALFTASASGVTKFTIANNGNITATGTLTGLTGLTSSGTVTFSALSAGGLVKAAAGTGVLGLASSGTDYEVPLTFSNGLTRTSNTVKLGGTLTANTDIPLAGFNLAFSGTGNVGIGTTNPTSKLYIQGTTTGNLFTINDGIGDIVNISSAQTTFNNPTSFTSSGDVSIAYDLNFTNPTASYIKSVAPLYIQAGETFNSSDLTLKTYNSGDIILDAGGTTSGTGTILFYDSNVKGAIDTTPIEFATGSADINTFRTNFTNETLIGSINEAYNAAIGTGGGIWTDAGTYIHPTTAGPTSIAILDSGSVGIGTTTPSSSLEVNGAVELTNLYDTAAATGDNFFDGGCSSTQTVSGIDSTGAISCISITGIPAASVPFSGITSGTNTTAAMVVGAGASLTYTSTGTINASSLIGATWVAPGAIGSTTPNSGAFTTLSSTGTSNIGSGTGVVTLNSSGALNQTAAAASTYTLPNVSNALNFDSNTLSIDALNNRVGIGTTTPSSSLEVNGNVELTNLYDNDASNFFDGGCSSTQTVSGIDSTGAITCTSITGIPAASVPFSGITSGTNTTAAMVVGAGASLTYTSTGTINASSLIGATWVAPGAIGSTTPNSGAFTTLTSTGITTLGNNTATVAINSSDWDISTTGDMTNIGAITMNGLLTGTLGATITGAAINLNASSNFPTNINTGTSTGAVTIGGGTATQTVAINSADWDISTTGAITNSDSYNGLVVTPNTGVITTGTWNASLIPLAYGGTNKNMTPVNGGIVWTDADSMEVTAAGTAGQILVSNGAAAPSWINNTGGAQYWQWNGGVLSPTDLNDSVNLGAIATASATVHLAGKTGENSFINTGNFGIGVTNPAASLSVGTGSLFQVTSAGAIAAATGIVSSGNIDFSSLAAGGLVKADITTGRLGIAAAGTDYQAPLTFSNGLTKTLNNVTLGGTLTGNTDIPLAGYNLTFSGTGNIGIGLTNPTSTLEIAGASSTISNASGDIILNAFSNLINFSGDSLVNFLNATASGQIKLGSFTDGTQPIPIGAGSLIYNTTQNSPQYYNGTIWQNIGENFWQRTSGSLAPKNITDALNLGAVATASAIVSFPGTTNSNAFLNLGTGNFGIGLTNPTQKLVVAGNIYPGDSVGGYDIGGSANPWGGLTLDDGIYFGSTQKIAISSNRLSGGDWKVASGLRVGDVGAVPTGFILWVDGNASVSGTLQVDTPLTDGTADITVGGGAGKINVGTVDPPYTINGSKYATYMASMVGIKEETVGKVTTTENSYIDGLGYRTLIDLDGQVIGTDVWLFSKTTNINEHIDRLSVLLTPEGQAKVWYEIDKVNKILAIYSSTPTSITYRLTAPRFDAAKWSNTRTDRDVGFVINDPNIYTNSNSIFDNPTTSPELLAKIDGTYSLKINGVENREIASFMKGIIANLQVGAAVVANLVADNLETTNLRVKTKLISPLADIEKLTVKDATVSGTLYAENIEGQTIDTLRTQINLLDEKYSTASSILADLQAQYSTYDSLFGATSSAIVTSDPLSLSPLAETTPLFPSDLALNSLNVHTLIANDLMANGSIFTKSISSFDTDLYIQPAGDRLIYLSANLMILDPDGSVRINGDLLVTGNILARGLDTQTATVSGSLAVGSSTIASESARFAQLTTDGLIIATGNDPLATISGQTNSNATIGTATIAAGTNEISIVNTTVTPTTLIYITPTSDTGGRVLFVKSKLENVGFTVAITGNSYTPNVSFNYWLIETK